MSTSNSSQGGAIVACRVWRSRSPAYRASAAVVVGCNGTSRCLVCREHVQRPIADIDIGAVEPERLPEPEPGRGHQSDHRLVARCAQRRRERSRGRHQRPDLHWRVDLRREARTIAGQQINRGHLACRVERGQVAREAADDPQPLPPPARVRVDRQPRPHPRQLDGDPLRARPARGTPRTAQAAVRAPELEPELAADRQVIPERYAYAQSG